MHLLWILDCAKDQSYLPRQAVCRTCAPLCSADGWIFKRGDAVVVLPYFVCFHKTTNGDEKTPRVDAKEKGLCGVPGNIPAKVLPAVDFLELTIIRSL